MDIFEYMLNENKKSQNKKCDNCGKQKPDVECVEDPYNADVNNKSVKMNLCKKCISSRAEEV